MKFRKINETTINCIITQDDLKKHGINLDDLFDRKKNAVEFIRGVILKAANSVNLSMKNDYTSMRISVLPDRSVSLTISQDPAVSARTREMTGKAGAVKKETAGKNNAADGKKDRKGLRIIRLLLPAHLCLSSLRSWIWLPAAICSQRNRGSEAPCTLLRAPDPTIWCWRRPMAFHRTMTAGSSVSMNSALW